MLDVEPREAVMAKFEPFPVLGRITRINAGEIEADGPDLGVGMLCRAYPADAERPPVMALVAAVSSDRVLLAPFQAVTSLRVGDRVVACEEDSGLPTGNGFSGRAVDALARPIDGGEEPVRTGAAPAMIPTLDRIAPDKVFETGLRAIDALLTIGRGQRMGIFAASGVGKTRLIGQIIDAAECDRVVVCLVGERGREVEELWRHLGTDRNRAKTALVAATSDEAAPMRARAVDQALAIAEHWRANGEHVLLVVDSITRLAMALREIGLIAGEPPTARAYTPNVFRELPRIVERCGAARSGGSITALFTVLSETDDADDPLVEVMKSLLDGHILLSRRLAQAGHFPAIDVSRSISRLFDNLSDKAQRDAARKCRAWLARIEESRILIESGMYKPGSDPELDAALAARSDLDAFLRQDLDEANSFEAAKQGLNAIAARHG